MERPSAPENASSAQADVGSAPADASQPSGQEPLGPFVPPATPPATAGGRDRTSVPAPAGVLGYEKRSAPPKSPPRQNAIEQIIGLKLAGWVGAIVLVIGAGLGIKYAYDQGWLGGLPPAWRLALMYVGGFGLLGAGEVVYRRINKISATGLFGAGVATLFLVSYAGHGYYRLYQRETAFTLMTLSTLIGAAVAMRGQLVSIAALSLIGGLLAPLVLQGDSNLLTPFLCYLLMLQVVALVLSWWGRSERWWSLRGLSLAGTTLWAATIIHPTAQPWGAPLLFVLLYAMLYQLELILSIGRAQSPTGDEERPGAGVTFSAIVTALACAAVMTIFGRASDSVRGIWMVAFSAATLAAGLSLHYAAASRPALRGLARGYRVQSAILLLLAVPIAFSGAAVTIGWAGLALALAAIGAVTRDRSARYTSPLAWGLAIVKLATWTLDPLTHDLACTTRFVALGQSIAEWTLIAWGLVLVGHAIARLHSLSPRRLRGDGEGEGPATFDPQQAAASCDAHAARPSPQPSPRSTGERERDVARTLCAIATALFAITTVLALPPLGSTGVLLAYAWLLVGVDALDDMLGLIAQAGAVLGLATAKWAIIDMIATRFAPGWSPTTYMPIVNPLMLDGVALSGSIVALYHLRKGRIERMFKAFREAEISPAVLVLSLVTLLITIGLSAEVDRVVCRLSTVAWPLAQLRQMAWTMLWTLAAVGHLAVHVRIEPAARQRGTWRGFAWFLAGSLAVKFCIIDTLLWWHGDRAMGVTPVANFQMLAAVFVTAGLVLVHLIIRGTEAGDRDDNALRVALAALAVLLWAGTLEIDRLIVAGRFVGVDLWPADQLRQLAWTMWWTVGFAAFVAITYWRDQTAVWRLKLLRGLTLTVPLVLAIKWATLDTLFLRTLHGPGPAAATPMLNLQTVAALVVAGAIVFTRRITRPDQGDESRVLRTLLMIVATILWAGTLEIDRLVAARMFPGLMLWPAAQVRQFAWTAWWTIGAATPLVVAHLRDRTAIARQQILRTLAVLPVVLSAKYLLLDTLGFRLLHGPAPAAVVANLQTFAGAFVFAALVLVRYLLDDAPLAHVATAKLRVAAGAAAVIMLIWLGTLEIDRGFERSAAVMRLFADAALAKQVALSIFWSTFAIACIAAGFRFRTSGLRYFGLGLFAFTLAKVAVVDLHEAETGYRILSFFGLGGLLLVTSVLYGKLSPKLLRPQVASAE